MGSPFSEGLPHPLCVLAAQQLKDFILSDSVLLEDAETGKMFGVLVVRNGDTLGFLAAYSGLLAGRNDWQWFVPPVFDAQHPDGYFKKEERAISEINAAIADLNDRADALSRTTIPQIEDILQKVEDTRAAFAKAKKQRRLRRKSGEVTPEEEAAMIRESQYQKAQLRRLKKQAEADIDAIQAEGKQLLHETNTLRLERRRRSYDLQRWLFDQYQVCNIRGTRTSLNLIFADTPQKVPPSGTGDCSAPKLLHYAYSHGLEPLAIAEFWWGRSPRNEVRHHFQYYPACQGKCGPLLPWMMGVTETGRLDPVQGHRTQSPRPIATLHETADLAVVYKPHGLLSVPGNTDAPDLLTIMRQRYGQDTHLPHRLDRDTSGVMLVARNTKTYKALQRQFLERTVQKTYHAILSGTPAQPEGDIHLTLSPDYINRPRQQVGAPDGKPAHTHYRVIRQLDDDQHAALTPDAPFTPLTLVELTPHTGRTHQLRLHCAHPDGLGCPILGDPLYGNDSSDHKRMFLKATSITFTDPQTGERLTVNSEPSSPTFQNIIF